MEHSPQHDGRFSTDGDMLPVVDEHDRVIGEATRREVHEGNLLHRAVHIVVVDRQGRVLLQKRSAGKDRFGGWWDISVGGHVDSGESYDEAARRELWEEMGLRVECREICRRDADEDSGWEFVRLYDCMHEGELRFDRDEIDEVRWVDPVELLRNGHDTDRCDAWQITTSGLISLRTWAERRGIRE